MQHPRGIDGEPVKAVHTVPLAGDGSRAGAAESVAARPVILLVDDDRTTLFALQIGLHKAGYLVYGVLSGEDALLMAEQIRPDLAILDISMPGICGITVAARLREKHAVPVVFLSVHREPEVVQAATRAGALGYFAKPIGPTQLVPAIAVVLARAADQVRLASREATLTTALQDERDTNTAVGVLMERYRFDRTKAFNVLRAYARHGRRRVSSVAADLLLHGDIPDLMRPRRAPGAKAASKRKLPET